LGLRAIVFDYGMVLTAPPDPKAYSELVRITGLPSERLDHFYWADRHAFDEGKLNGLSFWRKVTSDAGLALDSAAITELALWDACMWTTQNDAMLAWQQMLKQRGILTAILSNIGDTVLDNMLRELPWLSRFDVLVWSYQLRMAKPDAAIYKHTLKQLGTRAEDTMFIDDRQVNVDAANALGMKGVLFTDVERLRADLMAMGLNRELPMP
jgi:haloacid dehalogenase superfamily, subfamily IA, variant 3 with third motif having DD or ED